MYEKKHFNSMSQAEAGIACHAYSSYYLGKNIVMEGVVKKEF